jgi:hypothetical protein
MAQVDWRLAQAIKRSRAFFSSRVLRVGAGNPVLGALPVGFEPLEGSAHALLGDLVVDEALLEADPGRQLQGPGAALVAKIARTAVRASSLRRSARLYVKAVRSRWGRDEPSGRPVQPH